MVQQRMCSWFCLGTLHGSWRWGVFPYRIRYRHRGSGSAGIPEDNRSSRLPSWRHQGRSRRVQRLLCSDPWPSCCQRRSDRTQSCLDGKPDRMDRIGRSPWFRAPSLRERHGVHICLLWLHCSRHWFSPTEGRSHRGRYRWGQCRARLRWLPRTEITECQHCYSMYISTITNDKKAGHTFEKL